MILKYANLELKPSTPVDEGYIPELIALLEKELADSPSPGIGLAAPQIGIYQQCFIIRADQSINVVNPQILALKDPELTKEGCLSYPGMSLNTLRYRTVVYSDHWSKNRTLTGVSAIVFQHEFQHLEGRNMFESQLRVISQRNVCPCNSGKSFDACCRPT